MKKDTEKGHSLSTHGDSGSLPCKIQDHSWKHIVRPSAEAPKGS